MNENATPKTMREWADALITKRPKKSMPILSFPCKSLLNVSVKELISDSDKQAEGMKLIADRVPSLAAVSLMDLSVEAECFGSQICFWDNEVPTVTGRIVTNQEEANKLAVPHVGVKRSQIYVDAIKKAKKMITDRPVLAGVIGSFSLAGRLLDVTEALLCCYTEPEMLATVLNKCTDFLVEYVNAFKEAGADGVVIAEPLTGLLPFDLAEEFSTPYIKRIVDSCQDENFLVVYHNCGNTAISIIDSILKTGAKIYHFGNAIDMKEMMEHIPENVIAMGNIDPEGQFKSGTPESMREAVFSLLNACRPYPNFVISSGCDIPPTAKWENITAYFNAIDEYYKE